MIRKNVLKSIIANQHNQVKHEVLLSRKLDLPINTGKIIVLTGVRRCGKTSLLKLALSKIHNLGVDVRHTIYISFDDERLDLQVDELDYILQAYRELYPETELKKCYFFLDEIQNVSNWEKFVRRVYDNETTNIFISGSNSKQLGSEIATSLRGRTIQYELYPLSFEEYLLFNNVKLELHSDKNRSIIVKTFYQYLKEGGFPETINRESELRNRILNDYFVVLLFRDIIERYKVTKIYALKYFIKKLIVNIGKPFSINKLHNELKSQGIRIDREYLYDVLGFVEAVYLGQRLYKFDYSIVNREMSERKIYFIDNGLLNAISYHFSDNYGLLLENAVYLWLKQKFGENLFFYNQKNECDFIVFNKDKPAYCMQVCFDLSDLETRQREIEGLISAMTYFKLKSGIIVTAEHEELINQEDMKISIIPAFKLMLNESSVEILN